ncbi:MAG: TetR/AcrR family transcriptional regulator [Proteobacteria bacterium]|nr:TetR/AcrR family transcriptional regulator [Pseudomonadota bacterium]
MQENPHNSKSAWLKLGIQTIDNKGLKELKIDTLCKQLDVTKGCFYHWFKSKSDYEIQILEFWKQRFTNAFITHANLGNSPQEKLSLLGRRVIEGVNNENRLEFEINAWSFNNDNVKKFVLGVYKKRYDYVNKLLREIYPDEKEAKRHSLILYSLVVGVDFFYRKLSLEELEMVFSDYLIN